MQKGDEVVVKIKIVWQNVFKISEEITTAEKLQAS